MSFIFVQNFNFIDDDHKELSLSKQTDFKIEIETLDSWISFNTYSNEMKFFSHVNSFMICKIPKLQIKKCSNKGDMIKKIIFGIKSSRAHNSDKTYIFLLKI